MLYATISKRVLLAILKGTGPSLSLSLITRITDGEGDDDGRDKHCRRRRWPPYAASDPPPHPPCLQAMAIIPPLSLLSHPHHQVSGNNKLPPPFPILIPSLYACIYILDPIHSFSTVLVLHSRLILGFRACLL